MTRIRDGEVFLIKTSDRELGIKSLLKNFDLKEYHGKKVALKANFNSSDPFPASTHIDTLGSIVNGKRIGGPVKRHEIKLSRNRENKFILGSYESPFQFKVSVP